MQYHASLCSDNAVRESISTKFYVDNFFFTANQPEILINMYNQIKPELLKGGFHLREWISNSEEVRAHIDQADLTESSSVKALGYDYHSHSDLLGFRTLTLNESAVTKREILASHAAIFDPLGVLTPLTIRSKMILRQINKDKLAWDQEVSPEVRKAWVKLCEEYKGL